MLAAASGAALLCLAGGCSSPVEVTLPGRADDPGCRAAAASWPTEVSGLAPVDTTAGTASVRAWGDPPIIARCGLPPLSPTTQECLSVNGVDWVVSSFTDGTGFTSYGRDPAIEVLVPSRYAPEPMVLPAFTEAAAALPTNGRQCL